VPLLSLVFSVVLVLACALPLRAQVAGCRGPHAPNIALDWHEPAALALRAAVARSLAAELASAGIGVCTGNQARSTPVARIELEAVESRDRWRIRVHDDVTDKTVERTVALTGMPPDSWSVALALYIEELLHASWTELQLARRVHLARRSHPVPAAVTREVTRALQPVADSPAALRLGLGGFAIAWSSGLNQAGAQLAVHMRALSWLEPGLRLSYAFGLTTHTPHGAIDTQLLAAGLNAELLMPLSDTVWLRWPQAIDFGRLAFHARPDALATGRDAAGATIYVTHGLGLRIALPARLALSAAARFAWALLPARAADDRQVATGLTGVGGQLELMIDASF